jgi:hypothetical protein
VPAVADLSSLVFMSELPPKVCLILKISPKNFSTTPALVVDHIPFLKRVSPQLLSIMTPNFTHHFDVHMILVKPALTLTFFHIFSLPSTPVQSKDCRVLSLNYEFGM